MLKMARARRAGYKTWCQAGGLEHPGSYAQQENYITQYESYLGFAIGTCRDLNIDPGSATSKALYLVSAQWLAETRGLDIGWLGDTEVAELVVAPLVLNEPGIPSMQPLEPEQIEWAMPGAKLMWTALVLDVKSQERESPVRRPAENTPSRVKFIVDLTKWSDSDISWLADSLRARDIPYAHVGREIHVSQKYEIAVRTIINDRAS
jgi:hypothetical protein